MWKKVSHFRPILVLSTFMHFFMSCEKKVSYFRPIFFLLFCTFSCHMKKKAHFKYYKHTASILLYCTKCQCHWINHVTFILFIFLVIQLIPILGHRFRDGYNFVWPLQLRNCDVKTVIKLVSTRDSESDSDIIFFQ